MTDSKILPVVGYGSSILREVCIEVENKPEVHVVVKNLLKTMQGLTTAVGLAAPQINSNLSIFGMKVDREIVVINPVIKKRRGSKPSNEGCMSIPGIHATVPSRDEIIDVEFFDVNFNRQKMRLRGFDAIVFQHEYDHLNGILFTDRLTKIGQEEVADKLAEIEKGTVKSYYDMIFPNL